MTSSSAVWAPDGGVSEQTDQRPDAALVDEGPDATAWEGPETGEEPCNEFHEHSDEGSGADVARLTNLARLEAAWRTWVKQHRGTVPRRVPECEADLCGLPIDDSILEEVTLELG